ncbi:glycosyltransferase [Desulfofalx alkaliphila]|uniref:glycosyltransferase n=1 Tax=Desulfofalx alkaliphila TaxID=105483 RepID=UPI0004E23E02|nr:glycosyltransferase [Desulfofalx alkaliphila]
MRILLITTLYPGYVSQSNIQATHAVHNFAKEWVKENELKVIRLWPYYPNIFRCLKKTKTMNKLAYEESFILDNVNIYRVPIPKIPKVRYRNKDIRLVAKKIIKTIINKENPDIIICDMLNPSIYIGELVAKACHSVLLASLHNSDIVYLSKKKNYKRFINTDQNVDKIVFRSKKIKENFLKVYDGNKNEKDYYKILFGINKTDIINSNKLERKIANANKIIMIACSLKKIKKVDVLINAFARIKDKKGYILKIIGDGPERVRLEKQVKALGSEDYIYFEGEKTRDETLALMEEADIFAMVSSPETFGLVYVEAMAKGCITIGSKGEGIDGVIIDGENGFLCIPDDIENLKVTLEKAIMLNIKDKKRIIYSAIDTASVLNHEDLAAKFLERIKNDMD